MLWFEPLPVNLLDLGVSRKHLGPKVQIFSPIRFLLQFPVCSRVYNEDRVHELWLLNSFVLRTKPYKMQKTYK